MSSQQGTDVAITMAMMNAADVILRNVRHTNTVGKVDATVLRYLTRCEECALSDGTEKSIPFEIVQKIPNLLRKHCNTADLQVLKTVRLHQLMKGSEILERKPAKQEENSNIAALREKWKGQLASKEYFRMTKGIKQTGKNRDDDEVGPLDVKETHRQLTIGFNILLTMVACFFFGFYASQYAYPEPAMRVLFGVLVSVVATGAEIYFLIRTSL